MKKYILVILVVFLCSQAFAQTAVRDSLLKVKDSTFKAMVMADSLKLEKRFSEIQRWDVLRSAMIIPLVNGGEYSSVVPVSNPTEVPDPKIDYKLLFELTFKNPDSVARDLNYGMAEIARIINLHIASGIPASKIFPVIVVHGGALFAIASNDYYNKHYKLNNPNLTLMKDLEKIGTKFIACGQAMAFLDIKKDDLSPEVKISLTAQTVLSSYQLKGYVVYNIGEDKRK